MKQIRIRTMVMIVGITAAACHREERGAILSGGREVKSWLADLHDPKPTVRRNAVLKLGNAGDTDPSVTEALVAALHDPDPVVRRDTVRALAKLTKPSEAIQAQLRALSQTDPDALVRDYAKRALDHFGAMP